MEIKSAHQKVLMEIKSAHGNQKCSWKSEVLIKKCSWKSKVLMEIKDVRTDQKRSSKVQYSYVQKKKPSDPVKYQMEAKYKDIKAASHPC